MRQIVMVEARARVATVIVLTFALGACSFDRAAMRDPDERPMGMRDGGAAMAGRRAPPAEDAGRDAGRDAETPPPKRDAEPQPMPDAGDAAIDAGVDASQPPDAAMDAALDAAPPEDDDADVPEPDASDPCPEDPPPCVCPHEADDDEDEEDDGCEPELCPLDECAPDDDCRFERFATSGYYFCDDERTWQQARDRCDALEGARLVSIESEEEDQFVFERIDDKTWLGGNDREDEGRWRWTGGDDFYDEDDGPIDGAFENWDSSEPNDIGLSGSAPDCLLYWYENAAWADGSCGDEHGYVCEID